MYQQQRNFVSYGWKRENDYHAPLDAPIPFFCLVSQKNFMSNYRRFTLCFGCVLCLICGCSQNIGTLAQRAISLRDRVQVDPRIAVELIDVYRQLGLSSRADLVAVGGLIHHRNHRELFADRLDSGLLLPAAELDSVAELGEALCEGLPDPSRKRVAMLVARQRLRRRDITGASRILALIRSDPRAAYLQGVIALSQRDLQRAERRFVAAAKDPRVAALAQLAIARIAGEQGKLARAVRFYLQVGVDSDHYPVARHELAWLRLRQKRPRPAQRELLSLLRSGRLDPELTLAVAISLQQRCHEQAVSLARFAKKKLERAVEKVTVFLRPRTDVRLYYVEATRGRGGEKGLASWLRTDLQRQSGFARVAALITRLQRERRLLFGPERAVLRPTLAARLKADLIAAQSLGGRVVEAYVSSQRRELSSLATRADELLVELAKHGRRSRAMRLEGRQRWRRADLLELLEKSVSRPTSQCAR
jgi:hypothetical protein